MTRTEVEEIKGHFDKVANELRSEFRAGLDGLGTELRQEMAEVRTDLQQEISEVRHYTGVVAEDLRSQIRAVAEGVALANERISDVDLRVDALTSEVRRGFAAVRVEIHRLHETDDDLRRRIEAQEQRGA